MNEHKLKEQICEIGRRLYAKGFAAANDGNITIRLNDREVLCTPTMVSKGYLKPEDICKVDYEGKQPRGDEKAHQRGAAAPGRLQGPARRDGLRPLPPAARHRLRRRPGAIPKCVLPEVEVFLGEVPIAEYETPGTQKFRRLRVALRPRLQIRSFSPTTAPSRSAPTWKRPTSTRKSSTPTARSDPRPAARPRQLLQRSADEGADGL